MMDALAWKKRCQEVGLEKVFICASCIKCGKRIGSPWEQFYQSDKFCQHETWQGNEEEIKAALIKAHGLEGVRLLLKLADDSKNES